jgi:hypothetical protein
MVGAGTGEALPGPGLRTFAREAMGAYKRCAKSRPAGRVAERPVVPLEPAGLQHAPVGDPLGDEPRQDLSIERVEEATDVGVHQPNAAPAFWR